MRELAGIQDRMNKLFESALAKTDFEPGGRLGAWTPVSDVYETKDHLLFSLELPGVSQDDIEVRVEEDELVVEGERAMQKEGPGEQYHRVERSYGRFLRKFPLPSAVDREGIEAHHKNGVLRISLPKKGDAGPKSFRVEVR